MSLGKGYAVGRLLGIMDNKRLKADAKSPIWPELRKELMAFELTATCDALIATARLLASMTT